VGVRAVPVISTLTSDKEFFEIKSVVAEFERARWLLRYRVTVAAINPLEIQDWFLKTLKDTEANIKEVDAVLDFGEVVNVDATQLATNAAIAIAAISNIGFWRSITLSSGAFPASLAGLKLGVSLLRREDWILYSRTKQYSNIFRKLGYGNYGVSHTETFEGNPRFASIGANLRYTQNEYWYVYKGKSEKRFGYEQYRQHCIDLVESDPPFQGAAFSSGDANFLRIANGSAPGVKIGNAVHWRRDATNHHIHFAIVQLLKAFET